MNNIDNFDGYVAGQMLCATQDFIGVVDSQLDTEKIFREGDMFMLMKSPFGVIYRLKPYACDGKPTDYTIRGAKDIETKETLWLSSVVWGAGLSSDIDVPLLRAKLKSSQEREKELETIIDLKVSEIGRLQEKIKTFKSRMLDHAQSLARAGNYEHKTKNEVILRVIASLLGLAMYTEIDSDNELPF